VRRRAVLAWGLCAIAVALLVTSIVFSLVLGTWDPEDTGLVIPAALGTLAMALVGALLAARTGNAIGWLLLSIPVIFWISGLAQDVFDRGFAEGAGYSTIAYWFSQWPFFASMLLLVAIFYLFPTGHLASPRWRWPWRAYVTAATVTIVGFAIQPYRQVEADTGFSVTNPVGIPAIEKPLGIALAVGGLTLLVSGFLAFASLVARYRRGGPEERQQLRWLFAVGGVAAVTIALLMVLGPLGEARGGAFQAMADVGMILLVTVLTVGIPVATGVAIFRYHLYDLNLVVRKTVVYALLAGFVTVVYAAVVAGASSLAGSESLLLSIVATAIVAALFQPVRRWATHLANRLVFGLRAEPYEILARFSERVGGTYAAEDVLPRMTRVIAEGTGAERVELWLGAGDGLHSAASWPVEGDQIQAADRVVAVEHRAERLGEIRIRKPAGEPLTAPEEKLLDDLASQASVVLRNVALTSELQARVDRLDRQADELRASRARIVAAHDAERRRLERNIHDGAQQHLVALAVKLRLAKGLVAKDPAKASTMLTELRDQTELARGTLLDLASGIYPAALEERGIAAALEEQADAAGTPLAMDADGIERLSIETEAAVYFVCLEAVQNATKYARASMVRVRLSRSDGQLTFEISDDGVGFDPSREGTGSGLRNMRDRLAAFDGQVELESSPGSGTRVRGRIPIRAEVPA
jgi:signal transduction histidine kinase